MDFTIAGNDPRNTEIVGPPGVATYRVHTPGPFMLQTTVLRAGADVAVAQINWHPLSADVVRFDGAEVCVDEFLRRTGSAGCPESERTFVAGSETYTWRRAPSAMTLSRGTDAVPVATVDFRGRRGALLHVSPDASAVLDEIVVSMVLMWRILQQRPANVRETGDDDPQLGYRRARGSAHRRRDAQNGVLVDGGDSGDYGGGGIFDGGGDGGGFDGGDGGGGDGDGGGGDAGDQGGAVGGNDSGMGGDAGGGTSVDY